MGVTIRANRQNILTDRTVVVFGIPFETFENDIAECFNHCGQIEVIKIVPAPLLVSV